MRSNQVLYMMRARQLLSLHYSCLSAATLCYIVLAASVSTSAAANSRQPIDCYSCIYYANIQVSINKLTCISGESISTVQCPSGSACKVTFLQDSTSSIVHASRSCQQSNSFKNSRDNLSIILNARTTMYCREFGCNDNWIAAASVSVDDKRRQEGQLHCWVGYGRHIDQFRLLPCSQKILRLTQGINGSSSGQTPVCLLTQLTRQIEYNGGVLESAAYMADCVPHATSVYGRHYPMFEYERVCQSPRCNSGGPAERLDVGLLTLGARQRASSAGAAAATPSLSTAALLLAAAFQLAVL